MEVKVGCGCGQNYKFDVEPVNGRMPVGVVCPACGADGTGAANQYLSQQNSYQPAVATVAAVPATVMAPPSPPAAAAGLRIRSAEPPPATVAPPPPPLAAPRPAAPRTFAPAPAAKSSGGEYNLGMGVVGAVAGA